MAIEQFLFKFKFARTSCDFVQAFSLQATPSNIEQAKYCLQNAQLLLVGTEELQTPPQASIISISLRETALSVLMSEGTFHCYILIPRDGAGPKLCLQASRRLAGQLL